MKRGQIAIVVVAVAVVAILAIVGSGGGDDDGGGGNGSADAPKKAPSGSIAVSFAYSPEKEKLLEPLIKEFNAKDEQVDGKRVFVEGEVVASGAAETKIASKQLQPVAWSPASSLWGRLLNYEADQPYAPADNPSIVRTPLVIAMWEPMAKALGYPKKQIGFADILKLARSGQGWGAYGKPEFGSFKLVHTNPDFSTSGLSAVVAEYYYATGKKEGLKPADIDGQARQTVKDIERSIVHYGDTTLFIADQMKANGPSYASAAAMEEVTLVDFNKTRGGQQKLVAIYPKEGTFYSDNPFIVLNAPWVTEAQKQGASQFQKFLADEITPAKAAESGFRPPDTKDKPVDPINEENGADPSQPKRVLGLPEPRVLADIREAWREDRKPANILLVTDVSGSMADENRMPRAKEGLKTFLKQIQPTDRIGMTVFSDQIRPLVPIAPFGSNKAQLQQTINGLVPDGGTRVYDATASGFERVRNLAKKSDRINGVVVLTDGEDTDSALTAKQVVARVKAQGDSSDQVRVFTIAYSPSAGGAEDALKEIAEASGGKYFSGDTDDIEQVYRSISSFF